MSNEIFPTLIGQTLDVTRDVMPPDVTILTTPSRREFRARDATITLYAYKLKYELLRSRADYAELQTLVGFYNAMGGSFRSFLFNDVDDNTAAGESFGVGDGATTVYQLLRSYGGFGEPVTALNGAPTISAGGHTYTVNAFTGVVTFDTPPTGALTWSGMFYRRCRFTDAKLSTVKFLHQLFSSGVNLQMVVDE